MVRSAKTRARQRATVLPLALPGIVFLLRHRYAGQRGVVALIVGLRLRLLGPLALAMALRAAHALRISRRRSHPTSPLRAGTAKRAGTAGRSGCLVISHSPSRSPATSANRCGGFPPATRRPRP